MRGRASCRTWQLALVAVCTMYSISMVGPSLRKGEMDMPRSISPFLTVFLVDGLSRSVFERLLAAGKLPHIRRLLDEGSYVKRGVTCFPSMTGYCYYPLMTGIEATRSGVTGMRWFDRALSRGNFRNYFGGITTRFVDKDLGSPDVPTVFEAATQAGWTAAANANFDRGANITSSYGFTLGLAKLSKKWWVSRYILRLPILNWWFYPSFADAEAKNFGNLANQLRKIPKVHWCVLGSGDSAMHALGVGKEYEDALQVVDQVIGDYRALSEDLGTENDRIYAVVTDHGAVTVRNNIDLRRIFSRLGLRARRGSAKEYDRDFTRPLMELQQDDVCILINGDTMVHLYFRHPGYPTPDGWHHRVDTAALSAYPRQHGNTINLPNLLLRERGIELVVTWSDSDQCVTVRHSEGGIAEIHMNGNGHFAYVTMTPLDPLRYLSSPSASMLVSRGLKAHWQFNSVEAWLLATSDCEFPYAVVRLFQVMSSPKGSDIVLTALPDFDLGKDFELFIHSFSGGHGGLRSDQLSVPYILAGRGIKSGVTIDTARAEDVGATLMSFLSKTQAQPLLSQGDPFATLGPNASMLWTGRILHELLE